MTRQALPAGPDTRDDETGGPIVTGRPLVVEQGGALAASGIVSAR
jgi:hypothetical protein